MIIVDKSREYALSSTSRSTHSPQNRLKPCVVVGFVHFFDGEKDLCLPPPQILHCSVQGSVSRESEAAVAPESATTATSTLY